MLNLRKILWIILTFLPSCGGGSSGSAGGAAGSAEITSLIQEWSKTARKLEKQLDHSWVVSWAALDIADVRYYIYLTEKGQPYDFTKPYAVESQASYTYRPMNFFDEKSYCFVVRAAIADIDLNENTVCTEPEILVFSGLSSAVQQNDGRYLLTWEEIPMNNMVYAIYERLDSEEYNFSLPSFDGIRDNFYKLPLYPRGEIHCFNVRYTHAELKVDTNTVEKCSTLEEALTFSGVAKLEVVDATSVKVSWTKSVSSGVNGYNVYIGSDFSELVAEVDKNQGEATITGLVAQRQYSFGVRAIDPFGRADGNLKILSIILTQ